MEIVAAIIGVLGTLAGGIFGVKYARQKDGEGEADRILLAINDALTDLVIYTEWVEAGRIPEYTATLNRIRALADELLVVARGLPNHMTLAETAHQLRWLASFFPEPCKGYDAATPVRALLHRTYPDLFEDWDERAQRAVQSVRESVMLHNGGAPIPGMVFSPPPQVEALRARKRGLPPPDHSVQVRVVKGNARVHGSDDDPTGTEQR